MVLTVAMVCSVFTFMPAAAFGADGAAGEGAGGSEAIHDEGTCCAGCARIGGTPRAASPTLPGIGLAVADPGAEASFTISLGIAATAMAHAITATAALTTTNLSF